ncbi:MAG TPA: hypothetical protein VJ852_07645 [Gemmatimonadaceae bacterium]|nr:hypothetical protein [Gemmatimonadaceae bacterium]
MSAARLRLLVLWLAGFVAIAVVGGLLTIDLTGFSAADRFIVSHWSLRGLRIYLWFEAGVLVTLVIAVGWSAITTGLDVARGDAPEFFGLDAAMRPRIPNQIGYALVLLGSALVALAVTTLVLFNSCRYMRIV